MSNLVAALIEADDSDLVYLIDRTGQIETMAFDAYARLRPSDPRLQHRYVSFSRRKAERKSWSLRGLEHAPELLRS